MWKLLLILILGLIPLLGCVREDEIGVTYEKGCQAKNAYLQYGRS